MQLPSASFCFKGAFVALLAGALLLLQRMAKSSSPSFGGNVGTAPNVGSSKAPLPKLEFVHVPKTGGTSIVYLGLKHNITWSRCHFFPTMGKERTPCAPADEYFDYAQYNREQSNKFVVPLWHIPPQYFPETITDMPLYSAPNKVLFAVVRNPYERIMSEWYFEMNKKSIDDPNDAVYFNQHIEQNLRRFQQHGRVPTPTNAEDYFIVSNSYFTRDGHFVPQADYIFSGEKRLVEHVLKFETLTEDFNKLMEKFGLDLKLDDEHDNVNTMDKKLTIKDLSEDNLKKVHEIYARDFDEFGYDKISV